MTRPIVLVVDDESLIRWSISTDLGDRGYEVRAAETGADGLDELQRPVDVVVLDHRLPDMLGVDMLPEMRERAPGVPVIILTAHHSIDHAVEATKAGAYYYLAKPFEMDDLEDVVKRALEASHAERSLARDGPFRELAGDSAAMRKLKAMLARVARSGASTVLLTGESGTGKDVVAQTLHRASPRAGRPFMNITCSALPPSTLESELFGHERGAFTDAHERKLGLLEKADGGTVFLDEVGEMAPHLQAKLLRFLEDRTFRRLGGTDEVRPDVRIVAATNRDLADAVQRRQFREDLYYRLAVVCIHMPPLREREDDVEPLVYRFIRGLGEETGSPARGISQAALEKLRVYEWPGNVRELKNAVERAMLLADGPELRPEHFDLQGRKSDRSSDIPLPPGGLDIDDVQRRLLVQALDRSKGNRTRAGRLLGLNRDQIRYRIHKYGLDPEEG